MWAWLISWIILTEILYIILVYIFRDRLEVIIGDLVMTKLTSILVAGFIILVFNLFEVSKLARVALVVGLGVLVSMAIFLAILAFMRLNIILGEIIISRELFSKTKVKSKRKVNR